MDPDQAWIFGYHLYHAQPYIVDPVFGDANPNFGHKLYQLYLAAYPDFDPRDQGPSVDFDRQYAVDFGTYNDLLHRSSWPDDWPNPIREGVLIVRVGYEGFYYTMDTDRDDIFEMLRSMNLMLQIFGWNAPCIAPLFYLGTEQHTTLVAHHSQPTMACDLSTPHLFQVIYCHFLELLNIFEMDLFDANRGLGSKVEPHVQIQTRGWDVPPPQHIEAEPNQRPEENDMRATPSHHHVPEPITGCIVAYCISPIGYHFLVLFRPRRHRIFLIIMEDHNSIQVWGWRRKARIGS